MTTLKDIKQSVLEGKKIKVNYMTFYKGWDSEYVNKVYYMNHDYNPQKWEVFNNEGDAIKYIWSKVYYFNKKGFPNETQIL